jgi:hypothetical protein
MDSIGLWLVKTQTVGTGVSSVEVTAAFSATYDNYLITYSNIDSSVASTNVRLTVGSANTGYFGALIYMLYGNNTIFGIQSSNQASWLYPATVTSDTGSGSIEIFSPFLTTRTTVKGNYLETNTGGASGQFTGFLNNATSYTSFTLTPAGGTLTGGTIRVYGYRN